MIRALLALAAGVLVMAPATGRPQTPPAMPASPRQPTPDAPAMPAAMDHAHQRPFYQEQTFLVLLGLGAGGAAFAVYRLARKRKRRLIAPAGFATEAVLVVDLVGSTHLATHYGDGPAMRGRLCLRDRASAVAEKHGLVYVESTGDGCLMTFASVRDAVATARELLADIAERSPGLDPRPALAVRAAIAYGEVLLDARGGRHGTVLNKTFRIEGLTESQLVHAEGDSDRHAFPRENRVLLDEEAAQESQRSGDAVRPLGFFRLKGLSGLHRVYELV